MNLRIVVCLLALSLVVLSVPVLSQQPATPASPTPPATAPPQDEPGGAAIRVEVNEVIVPVTVTDDKGRFVSNLEKRDFQILDGGKPQTINFFSRERSQPVVAGFLIDLSNSSRA